VKAGKPAADIDAYGVLAREHRLIERVLDCLDRLCTEALRARKLDREAAMVAIRFLRDFADRAAFGVVIDRGQHLARRADDILLVPAPALLT